MTPAKKGDKVKVNYTGRLKDGTVFDSSDGRGPLTVVLGSGTVIIGFDEAIQGMTVGESRSVTIPAARAYGPHNKELLITVPKSQVPADLNPEAGQRLEMGGPNGELVVVQVTTVSDDNITLDANPPLAGRDLIFDIELVEIA